MATTPRGAGEDRAALEELLAETSALGVLLKTFSDREPNGAPSAAASAAFAGWLAAAGPQSARPGHFSDVAQNYSVAENSNKDLWHLFSLLESYIEFPMEEPEPHTFINLPLMP